TTYNIQHTTYNIQHTTYNIQHTTYNIQHTTYNIQHTTYNVINSAKAFFNKKVKPLSDNFRQRFLHFIVKKGGCV
ncbi:MAG: hypothetical protein LBD57_06275, partial [Endomicrobium sp.]|nr:hypothetical protein [Endomicrobium sp.]